MEISRRRFFTLAGAAAVAAGIPTVGLIADPRGAWMWADGSWLPAEEFPDLFEIIAHNYGLPRDPVDMFRLPDMSFDSIRARWEKAVMPEGVEKAPPPSIDINYIIKVREGEPGQAGYSMLVGTIIPYMGDELPD